MKLDKKLKEDFINAFDEEKWEIEEALAKIEPISRELAEYLEVPQVPIVVENIKEDSRMYFQEEFIVLRKDIALNYVEALKSIAHEYRHWYQFLEVKNKDELKENINPETGEILEIDDNIENVKSGIQGFIKSIKKDIAPIKAAISFNESSGFVEGNNNKFKLIKRILYGRCNLVNLFKKCFSIFSLKASSNIFNLLNFSSSIPHQA